MTITSTDLHKPRHWRAEAKGIKVTASLGHIGRLFLIATATAAKGKSLQ